MSDQPKIPPSPYPMPDIPAGDGILASQLNKDRNGREERPTQRK